MARTLILAVPSTLTRRELAELALTRRDALARSAGGAAEGPFVALGEVWGAASAEDFEAQLLSFALAATLGPDARAEALLCTDTAERLRLARERLGEQHQLIAPILQQQERRER